MYARAHVYLCVDIVFEDDKQDRVQLKISVEITLVCVLNAAQSFEYVTSKFNINICQMILK